MKVIDGIVRLTCLMMFLLLSSSFLRRVKRNIIHRTARPAKLSHHQTKSTIISASASLEILNREHCLLQHSEHRTEGLAEVEVSVSV